MSLSLYTLPLQNVPQTFNIALGGVTYALTCKWNPSDEAGWVIDLANPATNEFIAANIPLITGADLFAGLQYLELGGSLIVYTDGDEGAVPTLENLGVEANVYFVVES